MFYDCSPNRDRMEGRVFTGFAHPTTGQIHRMRRLTGEKRTNLLYQIAMQYVGVLGAFCTDAVLPPHDDDGESDLSPTSVTLAPNPRGHIHAKLRAAAAVLPRFDSRVNHVFDVLAKLNAGEIVPRVIILPEADRLQVPPEFNDTFCYWFMRTLNPEELARQFESRFDAIINLVAWEAREEAGASEGRHTTRQVFEQILDQAFADAEVTLEPLLSRAPDADRALALKAVVYGLLAHERTTPDAFFVRVNSNARVAPLDYFQDEQCRAFRTDKDGYAQLIAEGLLIDVHRYWEQRPAADFDNMQILLELIQYAEDMVMFLSRHKAMFKKMLTD